MTRLIAYTRVSTEEQASEGHSLKEQEATLRAAIERSGDDLVAVIADAGFSGKDLRRPGITRALRMIADGKADGLVCTKLDRLTRSVRDLIDLVEWFEHPDLTLRMRKPGGLGLLLTRKLAASRDYAYLYGRNRIRLALTLD